MPCLELGVKISLRPSYLSQANLIEINYGYNWWKKLEFRTALKIVLLRAPIWLPTWKPSPFLAIDGGQSSNFNWFWHRLNHARARPTLRQRNLETEFSLWNRIKCFPFTLRRRNLKTQQSPVILYLCLRKTYAEKWRGYRDVIVFEKLRFLNVSVHTEAQSQCFKLLQFEERFRKASFSWRISVDGWPNRRNKAAFSIFFFCSVSRCGLISKVLVNYSQNRLMRTPNLATELYVCIMEVEIIWIVIPQK